MIDNEKTSQCRLYFEASKFRVTEEEFRDSFAKNHHFVAFNQRIKEDDLEDWMSSLIFNSDAMYLEERFDRGGIQSLGRPFELYFRYETANRGENVFNAIETSYNETKYGNQDELARYVSAHAINHPIRQQFNWQLAQRMSSNSANKNHDDQVIDEKQQENTNVTNGVVNHLDMNLSSLAVFMNVIDPFNHDSNSGSINSNTKMGCCMYFVINGTAPMRSTWRLGVINAVSYRISQLNMNDSFGICIFSERKVIHLTFESLDEQDSVEVEEIIKHKETKDGSDDPDNSTGDDDKIKPNLIHMSEYHAKYGTGWNGTGYSSWRYKLKRCAAEWLREQTPITRKDLKQFLEENPGAGGVNFASPLMQTLKYLENDGKQGDKCKQIVFIHRGFHNQYGNQKKKKNKDEEEDEDDDGGGDEDNEDSLPNDTLLNTVQDAISLGKELKSSMGGKKQKIIQDDAHLGFDNDLNERDFVNKVSFLYSDKCKEYLNVDSFTTRIYTFGIGNNTNLAFLQYLAMETRGFYQVK